VAGEKTSRKRAEFRLIRETFDAFSLNGNAPPLAR
jgi:hypothetical protein